jgi:hypothetical protein
MSPLHTDFVLFRDNHNATFSLLDAFGGLKAICPLAQSGPKYL